MNQTQKAHKHWEEHLKNIQSKKKKKLCLVDATCGNGHDSLFLSKFENRKLYCIDIQSKAINNTKTLLQNQTDIFFFNQSHEKLDIISEPIDLITYNLGYLPGSDKTIITKGNSTVSSLSSALTHLDPHGLISVMIYTGHNGGQDEKQYILEWASSLNSYLNIRHLCKKNTPAAPEILLIKKISNIDKKENTKLFTKNPQ